MLTSKDILMGAFLPLVIAAVVRLLIRRSWGDAIALAGAFIVGYLGVAGWMKFRKFPPAEPNEWLLFIPVPLMIWGAVYGRWGLPFILRIIVLLIWSCLTAYILLRLPGSLTFTTIAWMAGWAILMVLYTLSLESLSRRVADVSIPLGMLACSGITALVLMLSNSQTFGQIGGALTMALLGTSIIAWWFGPPGLSSSSAVFLGTLLPGLVLVGYHYAGLTIPHAVLLLIAPHLMWIGKLHLLAQRKQWLQVLVTLVLVAIPLAVAAISAALAFSRDYTPGEF